MTFPTGDQLQAFSDAGGWVVSVIIMVGLVLAFVAGKIVSNSAYQREIIRGDKATDLLQGMTGAMDRQTDIIEKIATQQEVVITLLSKARR